MADGTSLDHIRSATGILSQLLKYIQQLRASESDPGVDVAALSEACGQRLEDLKLILPMAIKDAAGTEGAGGASLKESDIAEKIRELQEQTELCIEVLERGRDKSAGKLKDFLTARRVIRAYSA